MQSWSTQTTRRSAAGSLISSKPARTTAYRTSHPRLRGHSPQQPESRFSQNSKPTNTHMKIKNTPHITTLFAAVLFAGNAIAGPAKTTETKKADPLPLLSFADGKVVFDVEERLRWEVRDNN